MHKLWLRRGHLWLPWTLCQSLWSSQRSDLDPQKQHRYHLQKEVKILDPLFSLTFNPDLIDSFGCPQEVVLDLLPQRVSVLFQLVKLDLPYSNFRKGDQNYSIHVCLQWTEACPSPSLRVYSQTASLIGMDCSPIPPPCLLHSSAALSLDAIQTSCSSSPLPFRLARDDQLPSLLSQVL